MQIHLEALVAMSAHKGLELDMMGYLTIGIVGIIVLLLFLVGPFSDI